MNFRAIKLVALSTVLLFGATSCTREYICQCEISYSGQAGLPDTVINQYPVRDTKDGAKSICEGNSSTSEKNGIKTVENCHLF
jgi:hypothetical protein